MASFRSPLALTEMLFPPPLLSEKVMAPSDDTSTLISLLAVLEPELVEICCSPSFSSIAFWNPAASKLPSSSTNISSLPKSREMLLPLPPYFSVSEPDSPLRVISPSRSPNSPPTAPVEIFPIPLYRAAEASELTALMVMSLLDLPEAEIASAWVPLAVVITALLKKLALDRLVLE